MLTASFTVSISFFFFLQRLFIEFFLPIDGGEIF